ncbi:YkvA family protein [Pelomicrobium methylotrophicum]|uniref:DUF1232 domain-containing protein n=1 Tax=Pelomicrobium methylotrophicum TaxID=2602750 RepID=A0A5C7EIJ9_9PROT|nr:YkvA family protein [Pelomicrobium methylotrophicum]TXF12189.1 DUF1232 domain-containing protein [Pelomicrobium methylotrophicum]
MGLSERWRSRARALKRETYALYLCVRHPRTPWYAKLFVGLVVAYALSPIDLIPDFVPVLGYLDEAILLPLAILLALQMIPADVLEECRARAATAFAGSKPVSRAAAVVIVALWLGAATVLGLWLWRWLGGQ